jgi:hypothetical protein
MGMLLTEEEASDGDGDGDQQCRLGRGSGLDATELDEVIGIGLLSFELLDGNLLLVKGHLELR